MTKSYYSVAGELIGEKAAGGSRLDYITDATRSITGTADQTASTKNTYRYKPYGDQLAKTGTAGDPRFLWRGARGQAKGAGNYTLNLGWLATAHGSWINRPGAGGVQGSYTFGNGGPAQGKNRCGIEAPWASLKPRDVYVSDALLCATDCGCVEFVTHWVVPSSYGGGTILQHVKSRRGHHDCKTGKDYSGSMDYVEAWSVGGTGVAFEGFDSFWDFIDEYKGGGECWKGTVQISGRVGFYACDVEVGMQDWVQLSFAGYPSDLCFCSVTVPKGGYLLYWKGYGSAGAPPGFADGPGDKFLRYDYDCCVTKPGSFAWGHYRPILPIDYFVGNGWSGGTDPNCPKPCP